MINYLGHTSLQHTLSVVPWRMFSNKADRISGAGDVLALFWTESNCIAGGGGGGGGGAAVLTFGMDSDGGRGGGGGGGGEKFGGCKLPERQRVIICTHLPNVSF